MSDFDQIPVGDEQLTGVEEHAAGAELEAAGPAPTSQTAPAEGWEDVEEFVGDTLEDADIPDPAAVITIRTSGGETRYVPVLEGQTLTAGEALLNSGLTINSAGGFEIYLNNARIRVSDPVPAGSTMMVVASVKGG